MKKNIIVMAGLCAAVLFGRDESGSKLLRAAEKGDLEMIKSLVGEGENVNEKLLHGTTALMGAVWEGQVEAVKLLVENGADVNAKNKRGETALMYAAAGGRLEVVKLLVDKKADVNAMTRTGITAMKWVKERKDDEEGRKDKIIEILVKAGAKE